MKFHLDTNIVIALSKCDLAAQERVRNIPLANLEVSSIVLAELRFGIEKSDRKEASERRLERVLDGIRIISFGPDAAKIYGILRARLESDGKPIGSNDFLIAATALARNATLLTRNYREFTRVPELRVELL